MTDREKRKAQEKNEKILLELSKNPKNSFCADCNAKGPRWASTNLGVFLCMPCAGLHRKMGTHISKVKSLTLDTWSEEQLEHFMQWGNEKANALYNPHPENHPVPVGESEMEQYIRDKYERKLFQEGRSKPTLPARDTSKQGTGSNYESVAALNTLREMGWTDEQRNRDILKQAKGDVNTAIEILCTLPPSSNPQRRQSNDPRMQQLQSMGFTDQAKNNAILQQCNGSVDRAIEVLVAERRNNNSNASASQQAQPELFASSAFQSAPPTAKQNAPSQQQNRSSQPQQSNAQANAPSSSGLDLLGDVFGGQDPFTAGKKQEDTFGGGQQPNKSNKDSIMSLFGSAQPASAMGMGGAGFGNAMMMGGGGFPTQPQQQQAGMQNFMGNRMMGGNAGFMQQQQPYQQQPYQQQTNPFQQQQQSNMYGNGSMQGGGGSGGFNPLAGGQLGGGGFGGMQQFPSNMQQQSYLAASNQESSSNPFGSPNLMQGRMPVSNQNASQVPRQLTAPFGSIPSGQQQSPQQQQQQQQRQSNAAHNAAFASLNPFAAAAGTSTGGGVKKNASNPFA